MLILDGQIENISTRKDRTIKVVIGTQELKDGSQLFQLQNQLVKIAINSSDLTQEEIQLLQESKYDLDQIPEHKSPSQRLRNVLYRMWEQSPNGYEDFNLFYLNKMENMIEHFKSKLEP